MDEWYQTEKDIYRKYYENIKKVKKEIVYYKKEIEEKKKILEAAEALVKLSKTTKKRKLNIVEQQPTRKSKRLAEKKINEVH